MLLNEYISIKRLSPVIVIDGKEYGEFESRRWYNVPSVVDRVEDAEIVEDNPTETAEDMSPVLHVDETVYARLGKMLREEIGARSYLHSTIIEEEIDGFTYQLTVTALIYRERVSAPDGDDESISDVAPLWWEMHTFEGINMIERRNDGCFEALKGYLIG